MTSNYSPQIEQLNYIIVHEGSLFPINSSILHIEDQDNIADVTLNVIQGQFDISRINQSVCHSQKYFLEFVLQFRFIILRFLKLH